MIESPDPGHADPNHQEPASDRPLTQSIIDAYYIYPIDIGSRDFFNAISFRLDSESSSSPCLIPPRIHTAWRLRPRNLREIIVLSLDLIALVMRLQSLHFD
jgi:hypothetical protein